MGNGESTSRRISMQRSDEGTIQISENVMLRLKGQELSTEGTAVQLEPGERILHDDELKVMLEKAFIEGRKHEHDRFQQEKEKVEKEKQSVHFHSAEQQKLNIGEIESYWRKQLEEQEKRNLSEIESLQKQELNSEVLHELYNRNAELEQHIKEVKTKLAEERKSFEEKHHNREKELKDIFNESIQDVDQKMKPLQQHQVCSESQAKILECYRQHKQQPLKCSKEVSDFVQCVQAARLKLMQKSLMSSEGS